MDKDTLQLIITSIVAPGVLYMGKVIFDSAMKINSDTKKIQQETEACDLKPPVSPPLKQHAFFERMRYLNRHIIYCLSIPNKGKELIFKDILSHYVEIFVDNLSEFVSQDFTNVSPIELHNSLLKCIDSSLVHFYSYYENSGYTPDEQKILDLVMGKFNKWHKLKSEQIYRSVERVCASKFYGSAEVRVSVVLDLLLGLFVDTVNDAESTLDELNGDLKGLVYKNIKL